MSVRVAALCGAAMCVLAANAARADSVETVVVTARTLPLGEVVQADKTGTPIADIPRSIEVVPQALFNAQGAVDLSQTLSDVSGVSQGGQYDFGFFDRFIIRGLDASFLDDGLPEETSDLTGYVHSLLGVERVEVLKGPGSALYGSTEQGGTIDLVHFRPSDISAQSLSEQYGSFGATTTDVSATGPSGIPGIDWRVDGTFQHADGFRDLRTQTGEAYGSLSYREGKHDFELRFEYHNLKNRPDAEGIPFAPAGMPFQPLAVPDSFKYYTPYAFANQTIERLFASDTWTVSDRLTVNLRAAFGTRDVDLARNSGGTVALVSGMYALTRRQLRAQRDSVRDFTLQAEPRWTFDLAGMAHVLVTGAEARGVGGNTERSTADVPNIANVFAPVVNDGTLAGLTFQCDAAHSCDNARLLGHFYGVYAIDQIDVSDQLKIRLSARQDWFDTEAKARSATVPANSGQEEPCDPPSASACPLLPGDPAKRRDAIASWDGGAVYYLTRDLSAFGGYSTAAYPIFNTEEPESVGQVPETGKQLEAGMRYQRGAWLSLSSALYRVTRDNVFTLLTVPNPSGPGNIDIPQVFSYRVRGWETDVNLRPADGWTVLANLAIQDPAITSYPKTPADVGRAVPSVPSLLANLWTSYDLPISLAGVSPQISFGVRYRNHEYSDVGNTRFLPGAPLCDLALRVPYAQWTLQAGVSNLFDRENFVDAAGTGGGAVPGLPRTYFVKLSFNPQ